MLKMVKGCTVPFPEKLFESYEIGENRIIANVDADKIGDIMRHFIEMHKEWLFFILELPCKIEDEESGDVVEKFHKDVYYIDGCTQEKAMSILNHAGEVLINDGLSSFGFGCHGSKDEIMLDKYNVMLIYSHNIEKYRDFFEHHGIEEVPLVTTAWDTFTQEHPGESERYAVDGMDVCSIPEMYKEKGIYLAERRED